jgi:hypothetical protein
MATNAEKLAALQIDFGLHSTTKPNEKICSNATAVADGTQQCRTADATVQSAANCAMCSTAKACIGASTAMTREVLSSLVRHVTVSTPYLIAMGLLQHQNTVY